MSADRLVTREEYRALLAEVLKLRRSVSTSLGSISSGGSIPVPSGTVAALDGTGSAGAAATYSRGDHKHADANRPTNDEKAALDGTGTPSGGNKFVTADTLTSEIDAAEAYADVILAFHEADADAHKGEKRSIEIDAGDLQLVNDVDTPGADQVYGTDGAGVRGWKADPTSGGGGSWIPLAVGTEPLAFVSDGIGNPILVPYTP